MYTSTINNTIWSIILYILINSAISLLGTHSRETTYMPQVTHKELSEIAQIWKSVKSPFLIKWINYIYRKADHTEGHTYN